MGRRGEGAELRNKRRGVTVGYRRERSAAEKRQSERKGKKRGREMKGREER